MTPAPPPAAPPAAPPPILSAWPRSAQLVTATLLLLATALFTVHGLTSWRGSRPTELQSGPAPAHRIDLNQASRAELLQLPGVGDGLAGRIETERHERGGFRSVDDLRRVRGVGPTLLERLRPWVCVRGEDAGEESEPPEMPAPPASRGKGASAAPPSRSGKAARLTAPVNVNRATAAELQALPGIGPKLAQRILDERARQRFRSVDDLRRVPGIGAKTLDRLRPHVTVGGAPLHVATATDDKADD